MELSEFAGKKLLSGLLLGSSAALPQDWHFVLSQAGLLHLFCVSGLHIGCLNYLLIHSLYFLSTRFGVSLPVQRGLMIWGIGPVLLLIPYLYFLDFSFPAVRAFLSGAVILWSRILGLRYSLWTLLLISTLIGAILTSSSIVSILLSISAVSGFFLFQNELRQANRQRKFYAMLLVATAPWLVGLPIILYFFHHLPLLSPLINFALLIPIALSIFPALAVWALFNSLGLPLLESFLRSFCLQALEFWISLLAPLTNSYGIALWVNRQKWIAATAVFFLIFLVYRLERVPVRIRQIFFCLFLILAISLKFRNEVAFAGRVYQLNVRQGDAALIKLQDSENIILDVGPPSFNAYPAPVSQRLAYLATSNFQKILISHIDQDHIGGLASLLLRHRFLAKNQQDGIWIPEASLYHRKFEKLVTVAMQFQIPIHVLPEQAWTKFGPNLACYSESMPYLRAVNDHSPLCRIEFASTQYLSGGDMGKAKEEYLAWRFPKQVRATILKLNHHGSNSSTSKEFLTSVAPKIAIISAAARNRYRHPHVKVMARVKEKNLSWVHTKNQFAIPIHELGLETGMQD